MFFKNLADIIKLFVDDRIVFLQFSDRERSPGAGNNIFALGIEEIFTVEYVVSGSRVTCKCNTRT